jgi:DnaJ-class molecular chaperone
MSKLAHSCESTMAKIERDIFLKDNPNMKICAECAGTGDFVIVNDCAGLCENCGGDGVVAIGELK